MRFCRLFNLPVFTNEEHMERARVLSFIVWSILIVNTQVFVLFWFLLPQNRERWLAIFLTLNFTLPFMLALNHYGRTRLAGILLIVVLWLLGTVLALTAGGIHSPTVLMFVVNVLVAGLLFGGRGGVIVGVIFCLTTLGLVLLEETGLLPVNAVTHTTYSVWTSLALGLELIAIFQFMANRSIKAALMQAKQAEAALRRSHDELEARVQERTGELRNINQELESFSYSVSHDLRSPLRAVTGFTDLLMSRHARDLPQDAQRLMAVIKDSALQMNQLIEALLSLAHIDRQPLHPRSVNLAALARQTITELQAEQPGRKMEIQLAELPDCIGEPDLLRQVYVNLISNAIKFTGHRPLALIEVGFKMDGGKTIYYVRDNGAGFDMRYAGKLFGVFQRMHSSRQFTGTGVGLSIVQRIIHRHGGTIWAESVVDQGATFYFNLPLALPSGNGHQRS